jgi:acyl-CoA thioesterase-1
MLFFYLNLAASLTYGTQLEKPLSSQRSVSVAKISASTDVQKTILVMGDSISAAFGLQKHDGWVALFEQQVGGGVKVVNASISGETTTGGRHRLAASIAQYQPDLVIIELGGNDGLRGTPIKHIQGNLHVMIQQSQESGAQVLLLGMKIPPNYGERYTGEFAAIYAHLASENNTLFVPFFLDGVAGIEGMMQTDGIHPTDKAQSLMKDYVVEALKAWLKCGKC